MFPTISTRNCVTRPRAGGARSQTSTEAIEAHVGVIRRRLIAAKAGRSGRHDTARRIEAIMRQGSR
jgi:hypothetical protein